jgi:hypothetical protein
MKNSFGCAANRKIGKQEKPKTYQHPYILDFRFSRK